MADSGDLWSHKPWWCQPWSILLTGVGLVGGSWWWLRLWWVSLPLAVAGSWWLLQRWWITAPVALAVVLWWWLFLVVVPAAYKAELQATAETTPQNTEP